MRYSLNVFDDPEETAHALAAAFAHSARAADRFTVALSGGSTPLPFFRRLVQESIPWERVHVFWVDERYLPSTHPQSNAQAIRRALLDHVPIPEPNVHAPETGLANANEAARRYARAIRSLLGEKPRFDWMLLGLGADGHTASIFPGSPINRERRRLVAAVHDSPKPPPVRLTVTPLLINSARDVNLLVTGESKRQALGRLLEGEELSWLETATIWADRAARE